MIFDRSNLQLTPNLHGVPIVVAKKLKIPAKHKDAVLAIFQLGSDKRNEILAALEKLDHPPRLEEIATLFRQNVPEMAEEVAENAASVLISIYATVDQPDTPADSIFTLLLNAVEQRIKESAPDVTEDDLKSLQDFFKSVLQLHDSVGLRAKAYRLLSRQQHIYDSGEVYTDIRPIFRPDNPQIRPKAAVLVHSLMIGYHADESQKSFYCALNYDDLKRLNRTIERALAKHQNLSDMLTDFGMECLDFEEDD